MMKRYSWALIVVAALVLTACGSTSGMKRSSSSESAASSASTDGTQAPAISSDFSRFDRVLVRDFANATTITTKNAAKREVQTSQAVAAGKRFADRIAEGLQSGSAFTEVVREGEPTATTLVIEGNVTKYKAGNRAMRMLIGFGAGSANFDARVRFTDGATGDELSYITVDQNSWFLGGLFAAVQTVDDFVDGAATKVAEETVRAKTGQK